MADLVVHYRRLLGMAKGWAVQHLPGYSEDSHRDLLQRYGATAVADKRGAPRISATTMSAAQMQAALNDYERRGWPRQRSDAASQQAPTAQRKVLDSKVRMIFALWGKLGSAGQLRNSSRSTLVSWAAKQLGHTLPSDLAKLTDVEKSKLIEQLKIWSNRKKA